MVKVAMNCFYARLFAPLEVTQESADGVSPA
jgi:hypothetical protein